MAVRMRLARIGSKKNPIYRVVVADSRSPRDGRFIEIIGRYNPQTNPSTGEPLLDLGLVEHDRRRIGLGVVAPDDLDKTTVTRRA